MLADIFLIVSFCFRMVHMVDEDRPYSFTSSLTQKPRLCLLIISCFNSIDIDFLVLASTLPVGFLGDILAKSI